MAKKIGISENIKQWRIWHQRKMAKAGVKTVTAKIGVMAWQRGGISVKMKKRKIGIGMASGSGAWMAEKRRKRKNGVSVNSVGWQSA